MAESILETFKPEEWGEVVSLQAGYTLLDKDGKILEERSWKSKSYVRNFGRLIRGMFDFVTFTITDYVDVVANAQWNVAYSNGHFVSRPNENISGVGFNYTGAMMNIGVGVPDVDSSMFNLVTPFLAVPEDARLSVFTTQEDTVAHEFAVQQGITNASNSTATITEQALFSRVRTQNSPTDGSQAPQIVMFAYDAVSPGVVVAQGQTFVPRYTLRFQA